MKWLKSQDLLPGVIVAVVGALVSMAVVLSNAQGTQQVSEQGTIGIHAEGTLGLAAAVRNRIAQAQVVAAAEVVGAASSDESMEALNRADAALSFFDARLHRLLELIDPLSAGEVMGAADTFTDAALIVLAEVRAGQLAEAAASLDGLLVDSYDELAELLVDERDARLSEMELAGTTAGRVADVARFFVALIVPLIALFFYWMYIRRRQRRISLERELEKARAISRTKDESIASLSHELRTPLTSIYGFAMEMVEMAGEERGRADELIRIVAAESEELSRMVDDLLTAASAAHGEVPMAFEEIDPAVEVEAVLAPLRALGAEMPTSVDGSTVSADPLRFRQAVRNLVSNARRHGGPEVNIVGAEIGLVYRLTVVDNGPGIDADIENRLFTRYMHEGDEPLTAGSMGLGLSIARLLAERMGGTIHYERREGKTAFSLELPLPIGPLAEETLVETGTASRPTPPQQWA